jgi:acyl-CoA dehydrogenase
MAEMTAPMTGISFELTDEQRMLQQMAREFTQKEIIPKAEHYDQTAEFPWEIIKKAQDLGFNCINIPEKYGGMGASVLEECILGEEISYGCSGISTAMSINNLASLPITIGGTEEQKKKWLGRLVDGELAAYCVTEPDAGSNVMGIRTRAEKKGDKYIINGSKMFISNASVANYFTIFAITDPEGGYQGMSVFVIDADSPGITVGKHFDKMGQRCADTADITFEDVEVPAENLISEYEGTGWMIAMQVFDKSRPPVASAAVGVGRRALEESIKYARERETFGRPIYKHQAVGYKIADMAINVEAARLLVWQAASMVDADERNTKFASMAKAFAADTAMQACVEAVQVFGGYGYMKEYPVEKLMRDVKVFQIYEGTSEIQRGIIVRELFNE